MDKNQPWSVKGVEPEAREAAKLAARRAGMTLGTWLNRVIRTAAAEELGGGRAAGMGSAPPASDPPQLPALPLDALFDAIKAQAEDIKKTVRESGARLDPALEKIEQAAEKLGSVGDLSSRVAEAEAKASKAALAVGPLERTVVRLSERLSPMEEPPPSERRRGFLGRLFGG